MIAAPQTTRKTSLIRFFLLFFLVLLSDQLSKQIILGLVFDPPRIIKISFFLNIVPVWNPGMSFGLLSDGGMIVRVGLTLLAFAVSGWFFWMLPRLNGLQQLAGAAITGGAIGNAIDRLRFGQVVDFIDLHVGNWHWPAFNFADASITLGAVFWACSILLEKETNRT
jgi:signal peptidase II